MTVSGDGLKVDNESGLPFRLYSLQNEWMQAGLLPMYGKCPPFILALQPAECQIYSTLTWEGESLGLLKGEM